MNTRITDCRRFVFAGTIVVFLQAVALAQPPVTDTHAALPPKLLSDARRAVNRGLAYLRAAQDRDGGWTTARYGPAVTALVAQAFANDATYGPKHPIVERALARILQYEQNDGGIYDQRQNLANYQTSVVLSFLATLRDADQTQRVARAQRFLTRLQYGADDSMDSSNVWYGGSGYNSKKRPDLSNTQMMLEALHASGLSKDDPVYQRALTFISRSQMNEATNDQPFAKGSADGGFIYTPGDGGESKANPMIELVKSQPISYGSMTYSGFKSMLYANVSREDPRIESCLRWIRRNYTLDVNPGLRGRSAQEGLYYYYHVFARALYAWGEPIVVDDNGVSHNWRVDLCGKIVSLQNRDGSWVNERTRWLEGDENYVTALAILSLQTAMQADSDSARASRPAGTN
ncbi:MAG: terpene cyclase/mutase family protein [Phycisphaerae bacterium]|nr:terpene cyclase/mutase family protein [Phycisphaerae bacterium]